MKKTIFILLEIVMLTIFSACCKWDAVSENFQNGYTYSSPFEKKYAQTGEYEVSHYTEQSAEPRIKEYGIWYPSTLAMSDTIWPAVVLANGTGVPASIYKPIFEHMASWGFIVVGNEDEWTADGLSVCITLDYILAENENPQSVLYHKVDTSRVGLAGHSQGGAATLAAATLYANHTHYKALCVQSAGGSFTDSVPGQAASEIEAPLLMMAGTGNSDANLLCKLEAMQISYDSVRTQPAMMGRLVGMEHGDVLKRGDAYTTAWMLYWLCGDTEAGLCFVGDDAEMFSNTAWQDVQHKNL